MPVPVSAECEFLNSYSYQQYYNWIQDMSFWKREALLSILENKIQQFGLAAKVCIWRYNVRHFHYADLRLASSCRCDEGGKVEFACDFKEAIRKNRYNL